MAIVANIIKNKICGKVLIVRIMYVFLAVCKFIHHIKVISMPTHNDLLYIYIYIMQTSTPLPLSLSLDPVPSFISALSVSPTVSAHRPALSVSWSPPQSDLPILNYTISYSLRDSGAVTNITTTDTRVLITKLSIGATYQVAVTARSALGEGPRSVWVHQTTFSREYGHVNLCNVFPLNNSVDVTMLFHIAHPYAS